MPEARRRAAWAACLALSAHSLCLPAMSAAGTIYVVRRAWHVDVGFSASELVAPLAGVGDEYPRLQFLVIGFGDKRYVMARHHGLGTLAAALWPGDGMMLVTGLGAAPAQAFGRDHVVALDVSAEQLRAAQDFVWSTFASDTGRAKQYAEGPYAGSLYFAATAHYSALYTCNTWVADVLRAGGLPIRRTAVVLAEQVWRQVRRESERQQSGGTTAPAPVR